MRSLAVYCGSSPGGDPAYRSAAEELGRLCAERSVAVVYGGGSVGLMGAIADAALAAGGRVTGVITKYLLDKELGHTGLTDLCVVDTMHERKALMAELSDAFVALPGSLGTLEEISEVMVATQLGLQTKACGFLNTLGYYDALMAQFDRMVEDRFMHGVHREAPIVAGEPSDLLDKMASADVVFHDKWLDRDKGQVG